MAKIKTLKDYNNEIVYPQTSASAVSINDELTLDTLNTYLVRSAATNDANVKVLKDASGKQINPQTEAKAVIIEETNLEELNKLFVRTDGSLAVEDVPMQNLPVASKTTLGVIKVGENLNIAVDGTLNAIQAIQEEEDPTVPEHVKSIKQSDLTYWNGRSKLVAQSITLTAQGWNNNIQTVTVTGVTASNIAIVSPAPSSQLSYLEAGIICNAQSTNTLTFMCEETPSENLIINIVIGD